MKKLLVIVDMQNDFVDGSLGTEEARAIVPRVAALAKEYQAGGDDIVFTLDTHGENYLDTLEGKKLPVVHCVKGTYGWELVSQLKDVPGPGFEKNGFGSMGLAHFVSGKEYQEITLVGLCTDICVISNAMLIKSVLTDTPVKVMADCCAGVTPKSHETALEAMKMCQIEIG